MNYKLASRSVLQIVLFTLVCISLVIGIFIQSSDIIAENKRQYLISQLNTLVNTYDNDILADSYTQTLLLAGRQSEVTIYPAMVNNIRIARLIKHTTSKGYSGDITLLTAIDEQHKVIGVRILEHKETPGLGDKIERKKSDWITQFNNVSLASYPKEAWTISSRGGQFDALTGATITPLAVISAVEEVLRATTQ